MPVPKIHFAGVKEDRERMEPDKETGATHYPVIQPGAVLVYKDVTDFCEEHPEMTLTQFLSNLKGANA